jgi:hypothetical protein
MIDSIAAAMSRKLALDLDVAEGRPGFVLNSPNISLTG